MTLPSLELNWLRNLDKTLLLPQVVFVPNTSPVVNGEVTVCSGCYFRPFNWEVQINDSFHDGSRGLILIATNDPELIPASLAHEWRHHWQQHNGLMPTEQMHWTQEDCEPENYDAAIRRYFRAQPHELDALRYERSKYPTWDNEYMSDLVFCGKQESSLYG